VQTPSLTPSDGFSLLYNFQYYRNLDEQGQSSVAFIVTETLAKYFLPGLSVKSEIGKPVLSCMVLMRF